MSAWIILNFVHCQVFNWIDVKVYSLKCMKFGYPTVKHMMLYCSKCATRIIMGGLLKLERAAWCLSFTNFCIIKQCVEWLYLHQHYRFNTDNLQYHFQLHKVLFSTRKSLLNFSMSLVLIRFRGSDLVADSSFNSFIVVAPSIDDKNLK